MDTRRADNLANDWAALGGGEPWARRLRMRDAGATGGNALPKDDPPDVMRFKAPAAKRLQAHRWRRRMGLRCLTVRVDDRTVRHLISTGYLALESSGATPAVAIALEAWITTISPEPSRMAIARLLLSGPDPTFPAGDGAGRHGRSASIPAVWSSSTSKMAPLRGGWRLALTPAARGAEGRMASNGGDRRRAGPRGMPEGPPERRGRPRARSRPGIPWR
jgi:hypothetical protein